MIFGIKVLSTVNSVAFCSTEKTATELMVATELTLVATELTATELTVDSITNLVLLY